MPPAGPRLTTVLALAFAAVVARSAIGCHYPADWVLENVLVLLAVALIAALQRRAPFSRRALVQLFVFLSLHEVGAHWTFAEVPYDRWTEAWFGTPLNQVLGFERNHYDRLVHLSYGLLVTRPLREVLERWLALTGRRAAVTTFMYLSASAGFYELIEWAAALVFGGELGMAYLGTQGDVWDGHKDMALALGGSLLVLALARPRPNATPALRAAYAATDYEVAGAVLRIGAPTPRLDLGAHPWSRVAILTACNPFSEARGAARNQRAQRALADELGRAGRTFVPALGRDPSGAWPPEPSFAVLDPTDSELDLWLRRYRQNAVVVADRDGSAALRWHPDVRASGSV